MKIIIFGSSGFLGNELVNFLLKKKYYVIGCARNKINKKSKKFIFYKWKLGELIPNKLLSNIDFAIHLSHDFNSINAKDLTINGTVKIVKFLNKQGIQHHLFFSSYSSHKNSVSDYGKIKFSMEQKLKLFNNVIIIRPGLVIGNGGLCKKIKMILKNFPIFVIPFSKKFKVPVISIYKLCKIISLLLLKKKFHKKEFNLFEKKLLSMNDFLKKINKKLIFLISFSFPIFILVFLIKTLKFFGIKLLINHENILGLFYNQNIQLKSDINLFR